MAAKMSRRISDDEMEIDDNCGPPKKTTKMEEGTSAGSKSVSTQWLRDRFAAFVTRDGNLDHAVVDLYDACLTDRETPDASHRFTEELKKIEDDQDVPLTWRISFLKLCHFLANFAFGLDKHVNASKEVMERRQKEIQALDKKLSEKFAGHGRESIKEFQDLFYERIFPMEPDEMMFDDGSCDDM